ncbi:hypothetical protein B0H16DRAFT_220922 [Mycena metata]|uniref:Secreted protein n=1 Tax=Mycena metata TaxID=1033252 RepID=A0AAD7HYL3_9AGAR|nr:hypothetical protein B0H16DRAFT_220922 [Mycena metata]
MLLLAALCPSVSLPMETYTAPCPCCCRTSLDVRPAGGTADAGTRPSRNVSRRKRNVLYYRLPAFLYTIPSFHLLYIFLKRCRTWFLPRPTFRTPLMFRQLTDFPPRRSAPTRASESAQRRRESARWIHSSPFREIKPKARTTIPAEYFSSVVQPPRSCALVIRYRNLCDSTPNARTPSSAEWCESRNYLEAARCPVHLGPTAPPHH